MNPECVDRIHRKYQVAMTLPEIGPRPDNSGPTSPAEDLGAPTSRGLGTSKHTPSGGSNTPMGRWPGELLLLFLLLLLSLKISLSLFNGYASAAGPSFQPSNRMSRWHGRLDARMLRGLATGRPKLLYFICQEGSVKLSLVIF